MNPLRTAAGSGLGLLLAGSLLTGAPGALAAPDDVEARAPGARQADAAPARAVRAAPSATTETVTSERVVPEPPASYPSQPQLKVFPDDPNDASNARGAVPYDEIAPELQRQMRRSDAVSAQVVGESTQGRDIYLVTVTAPETAEQTAQQTGWREAIRETPEAAAADTALQAGYKTPIWFNGNIHGNEWEGADMTLNYIDDVVTAYTSDDRDTRLEALELLRGHRLYFTVTNNPDGRVNGTRATALGLDPNRDFITNTTPETTLIRDLVDDIQPLFFSDLHGYTGNLQVEPTGPPHGENYDYDLFIPHAYASALAIEEAVVEADIEGNPLTADGGILIPYRDIPSGWDDWPPIFTAQYVAFHGAVTSTVELPLGRGTQPADLTPPQRTAVNNQVGAVVMDVTVDYVDANADEMLDNQIETFRRGAAGEPIEPILDPTTVPGPTQWQSEWDADGGEAYAADLPRGYVIPAGEGQRSESDAAGLVDFLIAHGVEVSRATGDFTVGDASYEAGSYVVDLHQPLRGLANSLLDAGSDISDRVADMYDVSAWAPGLIWGATTVPFGGTEDDDLPVATSPVDAATPETGVPAQGGLLALDLLGGAEVRALNQVLDADVPVTWLPSGTAVLGADDASYAAATAAARDQGVAFRAVDADVLDTEGAKGLDDVTVGFTGTAEDRLALGQMGFTDLVPLTSAGLTSGAISLADVDLLYIGSSLTFAANQAEGANAVRAFLAEGKGMIGRGSAASSFATTFGLLTATAVTGNGRGTGIVSVDTPDDSVLEPVAQPYGFVAPATWFTALGANADVAARYGAGNPLVAGHWNTNGGTLGPEAAAGQAAVVTGETRRGNKAMVFGVLPTYRTYTRGAYSQLGHGLFWAAPTVEGVQPPEEPEPPVDPVTPELGMTLAQNPIRVGQQPRARVELDLGGADVEQVTLQIRKAGRVITTRAVRRDGSFVIGFPRQSAGQHRIRAVVLPTEATTRAASPVRILRVQRG